MAQTLSEGVVVPNMDGEETISATGVAEMVALGTTTNAALQSKAGHRTFLPTDDLDTATTPGIYGFWPTTANSPGGSGIVLTGTVLSTSGTATQVQQTAFHSSATESRILSRFMGSAGWSTWQWSGGSDSARVQQIPSGGDLNDARTPGSYGFWGNLSDNAPAAGSGTLYVSEVLTTSGAVSALSQFAVMPHVSGPQLWSRFFGSAWSQWIRIDAGAVVPTEIGMRPAAPGSMKSAPLAMSTGFGGAQTTGTGTTVVVQYMPEMVERVQLHLINRNPRYQLQDESTTTLSSVQIGLHNGSGGSASWTTLGAGATPYGSRWVEVPEAWRGKDVAVRYTWQNSGTIQMNIGYGWTNGARQNNLPLWAWLECEVPADTPVVGVYGDSLSAGVGAARSMADSYIVQWAKLHAAFPAFWAHSGDASTTWTEGMPRKWFLYGMDVAAPDAMIYAMGSNEVYGGASPTADVMEQRVTDTVAMIKKKITPNVYGALIMPRTSYPDETLRRAVNAWYPTSGLFRQVIDFASAVSNDDDNLIPAYDSDGIHLTAAGYAAVAAVIPASIIPAPASWGAAIAALNAAAQ